MHRGNSGLSTWFVVLTTLATASLVAGALSPTLTKTGSVTGNVGERISITRVQPIDNTGTLTLNGFNLGAASTYVDVPADGSNTMLVGNEHFEWEFLVYVGERVGAIVTIQNNGAQGTVVDLTCGIPSGLLFTVLLQPGYTLSPVVRTATNTFSAFIPGFKGGGPSVSQFGIIIKGLTEGTYRFQCTVSEAATNV